MCLAEKIKTLSLFPRCSFRDKLYIMSSQEAYKRFIMNPRIYLLPPMPRPPCRVSIIGPPQSGKSTMCKRLAQHYNVVMLDMDVLVQPAVAEFEKKRLDKVKEEATQNAMEKIKIKIPSGKMSFLSGPQMPLYTKQHCLVVVHVLSTYIWLFVRFISQKMG